MRPAALFLFLALISSTLQARNVISFAQGYEDLDNNNPSWHDSSLQVTHEFGPRHMLSGGVLRTTRFGLHDHQFNASYTRDLNKQLTATVDMNASPTHHVLARNAMGGTLQYEFRPAWLIHAGAKTTHYDVVRVNQGLLMLENYVASFSWAIGWRPARAFDTTAHSGEVRGSYYYQDKNAISLILAEGKEATSIGSRVVLANVRSATLVGRHWLNQDWALLYSAGMTKQGNFYTRSGVSIGIQYAY